MPAITFATPPGRPSVLRAAITREGATHDNAPETTSLASKTSSGPSQPSDSRPALASRTESAPAPLTFQKRILPQLTTSPESAKESFDLPRSRISLDEAQHSQAGEHKKQSLLSTALGSSCIQPSRSASTTNLGILRRAELERSQLGPDATSKVTCAPAEGVAAAPRPKLQFVEPTKEAHVHGVSRRESCHAIADTHVGTSALTSATSTATAITSEQPAITEAAPRKRSLVIQEHADVIERAAERAARQANLSTEALEQHSRAGPFGRSRHYSISSAGEETASTRSSWAFRSNSRGSSAGTSPTVVSEDNGETISDFELTKPSEVPTVMSIFNNTAGPDNEAAPPTAPRKLTFIDPAPSAKRSPPRPPAIATCRYDSDRAASSSNNDPSTVSEEGDKVLGAVSSEPSRKILAFAACPKPERAARLSPAHATRKPKSKLSASPAPHKLAYSQRLQGIRGDDPIRSPAPEKLSTIAAETPDWEHSDQDASEGSGYSEDEEDDGSEDEEEDDDDDGLSNESGFRSLAGTSSLGSQREASVQASEASPSPSSEIEELAAHVQSKLELDTQIFQPQRARPSSSDMLSPVSKPILEHAATAPAGVQTSPPRDARPTLSAQTSPRSGPSARAGRKLRPKDTFSHPMCFLPDAFEDSAPATPTEPDSDGYEPPRASLLQNWLSEGGSATSSRRASWQQQLPSPGVRPGRTSGEEGLAVPIALPPFRRSRERTAQSGVTSDGEQSSRSLGGNAAFIRESAGFGRSLNCKEEPLGKRSAGASPCTSPPSMGISMPHAGRPAQSIAWRHLSSQHPHISETRPPSGTAFRRASHSVETRKAGSAFTSPIGSYSSAVGRGVPTPADRPVRPSVGKQRAVSTSSHIRTRPLVAQSVHDITIGATSPPKDDAFTHLKHTLASSPKSHGGRSGATTPGWTSDGQMPSQNTSRYWTERLSSLAQAVSEELSVVGNAMLGKDSKAGAAAAQNCEMPPSPNAVTFAEGTEAEPHRRAHSVPLQAAVLPQSAVIAHAHDPSAAPTQPSSKLNTRRNSANIPVPLPKPRIGEEWSTDRDGEGRRRSTASRHRSRDTSSSVSSAEDSKPFQFAKKEIGEDGRTRMVVIHTSETGPRAAAVTGVRDNTDWVKRGDSLAQ